MGRFDDITIEELHDLRELTTGEIPRERVLAAIGRKQGDKISTLAERHGVTDKTITNWLDRFVDRPLEDAPYDEQRSGRPTKLSDTQKKELFDDFYKSPRDIGYNRDAWTTNLAEHHIEEKFGIEYTTRHIRNLMEEAGLSCQTARPRHDEADEELESEFKNTVQKTRKINCRRKNGCYR